MYQWTKREHGVHEQDAKQYVHWMETDPMVVHQGLCIVQIVPQTFARCAENLGMWVPALSFH